ncbi:Heterokaryon incompatibility protein (HET) domain containing protein, partial [Hyaloscypha variabilis]
HRSFRWIDAICINQADLEEKASQVGAMNNIFRRASLVSAWLGPSQDAHHVQRVFAWLHFLREGRGWSGENIGNHALNQAYSNEQRATMEWRAVAEFFRNPWFYRVWIVQEATVAKKLHIIYGGICMDWIHIGRAVAVLFDIELIGLLHVPGLLQDDEFHDNGLLRRPVATGLQNAYALFSLRREIDYDFEFTLDRLLQSCTYFGSTDPRDKVFALLGLATDDSAREILPDYEASPCQIYTLTATYLLKKSKDPLDVLSRAGIGLQRRLHDLPSWVPDWSYVSRDSFVSRNFAARPLKVASVRFDKNSSVIHMDGMIIDSVTRLSTTYRCGSCEPRVAEARILEQWLNEVETLATETVALLQDEDTLGHTVFRTIIAGQLDHSDSKLTAKQCKDGYNDLGDYFVKVLPLLRLVHKRNWQHLSGYAVLDDLKFDKAEDAELHRLSERFRQLQDLIESASGH